MKETNTEQLAERVEIAAVIASAIGGGDVAHGKKEFLCSVL